VAQDDLTPDIAEQADVDNAAKEAARREREDDETIRVWMSHPKGRDLLFRFTNQVCHMAETFVAADDAGHTDTHRTFLNLGERNIGAWMDERLRRHPRLYMDMLNEQAIEREARFDRIRKANDKGETNES
jgi:hypothetical protein